MHPKLLSIQEKECYLNGPLNKVVVTADGTKLRATNKALLPTHALSKEVIVVPGMKQQAMMSVLTLANNGYTTVFLPGKEGVCIYHNNDATINATAPPALQGHQDKQGL